MTMAERPTLPPMPDPQEPLSINDWLDIDPLPYGPMSDPVLMRRVLGDHSRDALISEMRDVIETRPVDLMELRRLGMLISEMYRERGRDWDCDPLREELQSAFERRRGGESHEL